MKHIFRSLVIVLFIAGSSLRAQQVQTLYFLENAPMRHIINPAFQPVSRFYLTLPVIGYTSLWAGNNAFTMQDFVFKDPTTGNTITPLHPNANPNWLANKPNMVMMDIDMHLNVLSFGLRTSNKGYFHLGLIEHIQFGVGVGKDLFGINDLTSGVVGPLSLQANALVYTEALLGYSYRINEKWTIGAKLKALLGHAYLQGGVNNLRLETGLDQLHAYGEGQLMVAAPLQWQNLPNNLENLEDIDFNLLLNEDYRAYVVPVGLGGALDLGFTYKPIKHLQISAAITDLGMIHWNHLARGSVGLDTTFTGVDMQYSDYVQDGSFQTDILTDEISNSLMGYADALQIGDITTNKPFNYMLMANLNVGVDANFWENRIGVGVYSHTRFNNKTITEEVTLGAAFRPVNWFNLAASYSFINGHWSNLGAALSLAPYDGLMLTLATDYVPLTYAKAVTDKGNFSLPYKTPGVNISFGIAIVAGTNKRKTKDSDKDGILDQFDLCPNTPTDIRVDDMGCPFDSDGDGVADYMDECPNTPSASYGLIDSVGCPIDFDSDGIADYLDKCSDTPTEAVGYLSADGCPLDTDGDGVYDYLDKCPGTPAAAYDMLDEYGCPLDTDGDGVEDYIDICPNTPEAAYNFIDQFGCPLDTDRDGVYDYLDQCPNTPVEGRNHVDENGCLLDTDKDGVYDYEDLCPTVVGVKENKGCPEVKREIRNLLNKAMSGIQFENGKATIKPSSYKILNDIAKIFIDNTNYIVEVQGHTDNVGKRDYNIDLSERRAQAVRTYLIGKGVPATRLSAHGYGPDVPIADNKTKEGRTKNRRVEFNITFEEVTYETIYDRVQPTDTVQVTDSTVQTTDSITTK